MEREARGDTKEGEGPEPTKMETQVRVDARPIHLVHRQLKSHKQAELRME